jgi:ubiquitin-conjugating enzyme E2 J1
MFLTPSGRFEVNSNICLSITKFHTEEWQSAWTIRSMLEAIIAFMPVHEDHDAIGAMDTSEEARKKYAIMSRNFVCDVCGPIVDLLPEKKEKNLNDEKNNDDINIKEENNNDEFKFKNSKSEQINYTEIFKKIRQSQYSKINEENKKNEINDNNNNEEEEENEEEFNEKNNKINNLNNLLNMNKKEKINPLLEEELEFFEIQKSIKFHENENKNEIEDNFINNKKNKNINKKILKNLTDEKIELLKVNKQQLEKFFKKQINFLKYYSKKTYEETRSKTLKNFNIIMTCIILFIFFSYWIITKLNIKISKYSKIKSSL